MTDPIILTEYEDRLVELDRVDVEFFDRTLAGRVLIRRDLHSGAYVLNPRQHVGIATLPSGRALECRPKVPARNLFLMLAAAFDLADPFLDAPADLGRIEEILAFVASRFASLVEERLDRGPYRAYIEEEENLAVVRGRIVMAEDIRRNSILRQRIYCRYADYSWDVPENQVVRQVVRLLAGWRLLPQLSQRFRRIDALMEEVTPGRYTAAAIDRFVYHRLNEDYRPIHRLCRLFLETASPGDGTGPVAFDAFLLDMNRLFEAYVTSVVRDRLHSGLSMTAQETIHLDRDEAVEMQPDIIVRRHGRAALVADCKYKRIAPSWHHLPDVYQMLTYCTALDTRNGLLIYPRHLAPVSSRLRIRNNDLTIHEISIDLERAGGGGAGGGR